MFVHTAQEKLCVKLITMLNITFLSLMDKSKFMQLHSAGPRLLVQIQDKVAGLTNKLYMKSMTQQKAFNLYIQKNASNLYSLQTEKTNRKPAGCAVGRRPHIILLAWELTTPITMGPYFQKCTERYISVATMQYILPYQRPNLLILNERTFK